MSDVDAVDTDDIWDGEFGLDDIVFFCWMSSDRYQYGISCGCDVVYLTVLNRRIRRD